MKNICPLVYCETCSHFDMTEKGDCYCNRIPNRPESIRWFQYAKAECYDPADAEELDKEPIDLELCKEY